MTVLESLTTSIFGFSIVFAVLVGLILMLKILTTLIHMFTSKKEDKSKLEAKSDDKSVEVKNEIIPAIQPELMAGELKLIGVDEKTAAIIMAVVSHESTIPLSELNFKTIRAID